MENNNQNPDIRSMDYLKKLAAEFIIIIDSYAALNPSFELFLNNILVPLRDSGKFICIMKHEAEILKQTAASDSELSVNAKKGLQLLAEYANQRMISVLSKYDGYENLLTNLNRDYKLCFVTQSTNTKDELENIPSRNEFAAFQIRQITSSGYLAPLKSVTEKKPVKKNNTKPGPQIPREKRFDKAKKIVRLDNALIRVQRVPSENSTVYTENGESVKLGSKLGSFSDGSIFEASNGSAAKIYYQNKLDLFHYEKCKLMASKSIECEGICWPQKLLFDADKNFVGYLTRRYSGHSLQLSVFKKAGLDRYFSNWTKQDIVQLAVTILEKIILLNKHNVLTGCINPQEIMVVNPTTVYLTNTDKYQVEGFPCMIRNILFLAPECFNNMNKLFLFNDSTESYTVSVLLFMIMMPGKPPYAHRGNKDVQKNIVEMQFPYASGEHHSKGVPPGLWRFVWSHLYRELKQTFFMSFQKDEKFNAPENRIWAGVWLKITKKYLDELSSGQYTKSDKYSMLLFPDTFRKANGVNYIRCAHCGKEYPEWYIDKFHLCGNCNKKQSNTYFDCVDCGRRFYYTLYEEQLHKTKDWHPQKHCDECKRPTACAMCGETYPAYMLRSGRCKNCNNTLIPNIRCKFCGRMFFTYGEWDYYKRKNLTVPNKCKNCKQRFR